MSFRFPESVREAFEQITVIIPAYNAESSVGEVVERVRRLNENLKVIVIDDGSSDATSEAARRSGATVISHEFNRGKGEALRTGFEYALRTGSMAVITLDADGQHSPEEIPRLIERWLETGADIIIGTRKRERGRMPLLRIITNSLSSWLVSLSAGTRIDDSQSGFRLLTSRVLRSVKTTAHGYDAESEILIKAALLGFRIRPAPIATIYSSEKSYIHPLKQPLLFIGLILRSILWRLDYLVRKRRQRTHPLDQ